MKKIIIVILMVAACLDIQAQDMKGMKMDKKETAPVSYTCPMHPQIHSSKPGKCPLCGMDLVKEKAAVVKKKPVPVKPAPKTTPAKKVTPSSKSSPKMAEQMEMNKMDTAKQMYTCPMHPEIHADNPGNCPKCGMKLIPEKHNDLRPDMNDDLHGKGNKDVMKMDMGEMNMKGMAKYTSIPNKFIDNNHSPKVVHYDLYVRDSTVTYGGKQKRAIAVNGKIPMPTLTFTEGDTAEIVVHNELEEGTTLHWHGLFLDNQYDGVANLTQKPIAPHTTHVYRFPIRQHGTHWYHSHFGLQEQIGMYGSMILLAKKELDIPTIPLLLSEWSNVKPEEIHRRLYAASDWFAIQKGSTQSYAEAISGGHFGTKITNEWKRMTAMDVSDIYYDQFMINGTNQLEYSNYKAGDKVRLRIANGGASSYFWLSYSGGKITVIASDGNDVTPVEVDRLIIGTSETYDVIITIPENKQYEFLVTPEDRTKSASLWLGSGDKIPAQKLPRLDYFAGMKMMNNMMDMQGNIIEMQGMTMQNQKMDMNTVMYPEINGAKSGEQSGMMKMIEKNYDRTMHEDTGSTTGMGTMQMGMGQDMQMMGDKSGLMDMNSGNSDIVTLNYGMLKSPEKTTLPEGPLRTLSFELTGNMNRYVWTLDNKTISESDRILIRKGENLRIIMFNNSMMRHPMHLHGHDFRVLNGQGDYAPLKNIIDIMPMERDTIEFAASESGGDWFFHCHILYHMMSGMGRIFSYQDGKPNPEITDPKEMERMLKNDDRRFHLMGEASLQSNGSDGNFMLSNTRYQLSTMWHLGYHDQHGYESETMFGRYLGRMQWWFPYIGFDYHYKTEGGPKNLFGNEDKTFFGQNSNKLNRKTITAGISYTLPMLFILDARIDANGLFRLQLGREDIPITSRLRMAVMLNSDKEYMAGFRYIATKYISVATHYDSDMGIGAGLTFTY